MNSVPAITNPIHRRQRRSVGARWRQGIACPGGGIAFLLATGCGAPDPDPCVAMCDAAALLYGDCLASWNVDWDAAGFADEEDFISVCQTWSMEMRLLEEDALEQGRISTIGCVDDACSARTEQFEAAYQQEPLDCEAFTSIVWNDPPWESQNR